MEEVKFISGDKELSSGGSELAKAKYSVIFPSNDNTRLVRRGILSCSEYGDSCVFVLLVPSSVRSVN